MALSINTNVLSLTAQRGLKSSQTSLAISLQRLSSGLRINSAKDDAAGLAISDRMTSQIRGMNQADRNANDAISMVQVAEGALSSVSDLLQRGRELSIQSANATNSSSDRKSIQSEINQIITEVNRIGETTEFNGLKLFSGGDGIASYRDKDGTVVDFDDKEAMITNLTRSWLKQSEKVITEYLGITASNQDIEIILEDTIPGNAAAFVAATFSGSTLTKLTLNIDMAELQAIGLDWPNNSIDQLIAHEMTHAVMDATTNIQSFEKWFVEGIAELVPGADASLDKLINTDGIAPSTIVNNIDNVRNAWTVTSLNYSTAYVASRYLNDIAGGEGAKDIMEYLSADKTRTLDNYFAQASIAGISDTDDFVTAFKANGVAFIGSMDITNDDTGGIGGADASGGTRDTSFDGTIPDLSSPTFDPLVGFNEIWPDFVENREVALDQSLDATFQIGANANMTIDTNFSAISSGELGISSTDVSTAIGAQTAISHFDVALKAINSERGNMGAMLNRFDAVSSYLQTAAENLSASRSRILDTDFARETAEMTKSQIMQQASTAILSQANSSSQVVLSLIG